MIAEKLRQAVLQAAISGQLTEQRLQDGTAAELLEQIAAKRARLVKEGKLKKQKSLPNIGENDDPFALPDSWRWIRFGDLVEFRMGKTPKRAEQKYWLRGSVPWVSISDMAQGETITSTRESVSDEAISDAFGGVVSPAGTLIMSFKLTIGRCSFLGVDAVHNEAIISVFPIVDTWEILPSYLAYALPIFSSHGDVKAAMKGNTLNSTSLNLMMVSLPPLAEQERIVAKLDQIMPMIDKLEKLEREREYLDREFAKAIERAILQAAISGKLTKQHPEDGTATELLETIKTERQQLEKEGKIKKQKPLPPVDKADEPFELPGMWAWVRLGEIGSWAAGSTPSRSNPELYRGDIPWVKSGEVKQGRITTTEETITEEALNSCSLRINPPGSVLVAMYGANIGDTGVLEISATTNQAVCACIPFTCINSGFLSYFIIFSKQYLKKQGAGGAQPNISRAKIVDVPFPLAPRADQSRVVRVLDQTVPLVREIGELVS